MKKEELLPLIKKNPLLALSLYMQRKGALEHVTLFSPDSQGPALAKYHAFCAKLKLKTPPYLMIVDDVGLKNISYFRGGGLEACYLIKEETVVVPKSLFDAFNNDVSRKEYVMSHELGHAKDFKDDRRGFMRAFAAGTAVAGVQFFGMRATKNVTDAVGVTDSKKNPTKDLIPIGVGFGPAYVTSKIAKAILIQKMEFIADRYASEILGKPRIIKELLSEAEEQLRGYLGEERFEVFKASFEQVAAGKNESDEQRQLAYAVYISENFSQKMTLRRIWSGAYPTPLESLRSVIQSDFHR